MPTVQEELAVVTNKLAVLLKPVPEPQTITISIADVLAEVAKELKGTVTPERQTYLKSVLDGVTKSNFEYVNYEPAIKVIDDPLKIKPGTAAIEPIQTLATGTPSTTFSSNPVTKAEKAALIAKLALSPEAIKKSKLTDKLDDIKTMFGINDDDLKDEYEIRWKVGDLVSLLQQAIKLERLVDGSTTTSKAGEPASAAAGVIPAASNVWPADMSKAVYDPKAEGYTRSTSVFGNDSPTSQR